MRCVVGVDEHDLGVSVDLRGGAVLAVRGPGAVTAGVVRAVIAQALLWHGPADLGIVTDCDDLVRFIPETYRDHPRPMMVMLTDDVAALSHANSAPRRALGDGAAIIVRIPVGVDVPAVCTAVYDVAADYSGVLVYGDHIASPRVVAMTPELTSAVAAVTGRLIDPEHGGAALADAVPLSTLLGDTPPVGVVGVPLGVDDAGSVWCDPVSDGPHLLVAGTTGSGKSEALRALVVALCARHSPKHWQVCLIDAKGGAGLDVVADVPHVIGSVTDLDEGGIRRAIDGLAVEMRRREHVLRAGGHRDIASAGSAAPPRLLVVIDEFAAVIRGDERSRAVIIDIAQRERSLGVHLVLATQRPAGSIPDDLRANLGACVCLRVNDRCDAVDVVGRPDAAEIPSSRPGRAMVRTPDGRYAAVQIAWVDDAADEAARQWAAPVHPVVPWLNPIASSLPADAQRRSLIMVQQQCPVSTHRRSRCSLPPMSSGDATRWEWVRCRQVCGSTPMLSVDRRAMTMCRRTALTSPIVWELVPWLLCVSTAVGASAGCLLWSALPRLPCWWRERPRQHSDRPILPVPTRWPGCPRDRCIRWSWCPNGTGVAPRWCHRCRHRSTSRPPRRARGRVARLGSR